MNKNLKDPYQPPKTKLADITKTDSVYPKWRIIKKFTVLGILLGIVIYCLMLVYYTLPLPDDMSFSYDKQMVTTMVFITLSGIFMGGLSGSIIGILLAILKLKIITIFSYLKIGLISFVCISMVMLYGYGIDMAMTLTDFMIINFSLSTLSVIISHFVLPKSTHTDNAP